MRNTLLLFVACFIFATCSNHPSEFNLYVSGIKALPTPLTFKTINDQNRVQGIVSENLFLKYKYAYADNIYGKVFENEKFSTILYSVNGDVLTPVLVTYDVNGNKTDSLNLFENASGYSEDSVTFVSSTLYSNMTIEEIDSTVISDELIITNPAFSQSRVRLDTIHYSLTPNGKIRKYKTN